jgi:hypothetical protein
MTEDFRKGFEDFRKWFEESNKGTMVNTAVLEQFNKQTEQFNTQAKASWDQFLKLIQASYIDATEKTIETNVNGGPNYKTAININGDQKNEFPNPAPNADNVYWIRHNQLVDEALALQKEIIMKVIETVGATIQKVVSPISISGSDIMNLTSMFRKP